MQIALRQAALCDVDISQQLHTKMAQIKIEQTSAMLQSHQLAVVSRIIAENTMVDMAKVIP